MVMFILYMIDHKGKAFYWLGEHRYSSMISEAKRFDSREQAEVERWTTAGTDARIAEVLT